MASFIVQTPQTVPINHAGSFSITLLGTGTAFVTNGTTFTLSGVSGVTKLGQIVASNTAADIQLTTGSTTGTLTVTASDGSGTATVNVAKLPVAKRWFPGLLRR